ncbi:hypothetical protein EUAN_06900 [Andreesenia angusta]|uniref:Phage XkdN-like protein n=1 Tax=Andreesenia angusta TaxID=39480 RepID=A0A1S1V8I6_9FIRM|nr:hypothetical protein [Andreesenia angusta]OHW62906.1 hypothetical protein EUAN_06900 [Andreesenia angusta]
MSKKTKATLAEIIARKKQGEMDKLSVKYYDSEVLGTSIEVRKIPLKKFMSLVEDMEDEGDAVEGLDSMNKLIFEVCPMFREDTKEAMEIYGVKEPTDLPSAILEEQMNEMKDIVEIANTFYGLDKIEADIKKG